MAPKWSEWKNNSSFSDIINAPSVVSTATDHRNFFYRGNEGLLHHTEYTLIKGVWKKIKTEILGTERRITGSPAAVTGGPNRIDVFARGDDNHLYHIRFDGTMWHPWDNLDKRGLEAVLSESPAAAASKGRLDVFVRGTDNHISTLHWNQGEVDERGNAVGWSALKDITKPGTSLMSAPTATASGANFLDVFAVWNDGHMYHISSADGKVWSAWDNLDGKGSVASFNEAPVAVSSKDRLDVFVRNAGNNHLWHAAWQKGVTSGWSVDSLDLGGPLTSAPSAFSSSAGHLDCFARVSGTFKHRFWE